LTYTSKISERRLRTKLYDKRDYFNFPIVNFPFLCSSILAAPAYGVYISQLTRYSRACGSCQDFLDSGLLLTRKLPNQGFFSVKLKSSLRKFYSRHHDLVNRYGISVSQRPWICSTCRKYLPVLSSFMTYDRVCNYTQRQKLSTPIFFWNDKWYDKYHEITDQIISRTQWWPFRTLHWL